MSNTALFIGQQVVEQAEEDLSKEIGVKNSKDQINWILKEII